MVEGGVVIFNFLGDLGIKSYRAGKDTVAWVSKVVEKLNSRE